MKRFHFSCIWSCHPLPGFTLVEVLVVLAVIGLIASVSVKIVYVNRNLDCLESTEQILENLRRAILGNPPAPGINGSSRFSGYLTDMGGLPELLGDYLQPAGLWTNSLDSYGAGDLPAWEYDEESRIWAGWNGPYIDPPEGVLVDGWGNPLIFVDSATRPGQVEEGWMIIKSLGANGLENDSDTGYDTDLQIFVRPVKYNGAVAGYAVGTASKVRIHYPEKGLVTSREVQLNEEDPYFRFDEDTIGTDITSGIRSLTVFYTDRESRVVVLCVGPTANWVGELE